MDPTPDLLFDGPEDATVTLALAHGAGAAMDSPFMNGIVARLAALGHRVARFEFPYMAARRVDPRRRPPDRQPVLLATWRAVVAELGGPDRVVMGGKSMGGRMASLVAAEDGARGLVCLGYPFHPPGDAESTRVAHLADLRIPALIVQGTRDPFGTTKQIVSYRLPASIALEWIADGDHDLKPRKASGRTQSDGLDQAAAAVDNFLRNRVR